MTFHMNEMLVMSVCVAETLSLIAAAIFEYHRQVCNIKLLESMILRYAAKQRNE